MKKALSFSLLLVSIILLGMVLYSYVSQPEIIEIGQTIEFDDSIQVTLSDIIMTRDPKIDWEEDSDDSQGGGITITFDYSELIANLRDDEILVRVEFNIKNDSNLDISTNWINGEALYDNQYKYYPAFGNGDNIKMLSEGKYYMFFKLSKEAQSSDKPLQANFYILGRKFVTAVR